jgi:hypothetical protein
VKILKNAGSNTSAKTENLPRRPKHLKPPDNKRQPITRNQKDKTRELINQIRFN